MGRWRRDTTAAWQSEPEHAPALAYRVEYSPAAEEQLSSLTARQRAIIFDTVDEQLIHEPTVETRNRKPMRPNPIAPWELRIGNLRVYYDSRDEPETVVTVLAIGIKKRNRVFIA